jgi:hypothetical protein
MSEDPNNLLKYIVATVDAMREDMVRKTEFQSLREQVEYVGGQLETVRDQMATKSDLDQMATKGDMARVESRLEVGATAIRGDIEQVNLRLDSIERALSSRLLRLKQK